jgi:hypothetical protein
LSSTSILKINTFLQQSFEYQVVNDPLNKHNNGVSITPG